MNMLSRIKIWIRRLSIEAYRADVATKLWPKPSFRSNGWAQNSMVKGGAGMLSSNTMSSTPSKSSPQPALPTRN